MIFAREDSAGNAQWYLQDRCTPTQDIRFSVFKPLEVLSDEESFQFRVNHRAGESLQFDQIQGLGNGPRSGPEEKEIF